MRDDARFDAWLDDALARYVARIPGEVDAAGIVDALEAAGRLGRPRPTLRDRVGERWWGRMRLAAALALAVALVALGIVVGSRRPADPTPLVMATTTGLVRATGAGVPMTTVVDGAHAEPRWSPDEAWIAATRPDGSIAIVASDGTAHVSVPGVAFAWTPEAAPGGPRMLVRSGDGSVALVDPEDGSAVSIPASVAATGALTTSARHAAWASGPEVYIADLTADGPGAARLLTRTPRSSIRELAFSPDGQTLAWLAADCLGTCEASLSTVGMDGLPAVRAVDERMAVDSSLSWDPSGSSLLVVRTVDALTVTLVDADDGRVTALVPVADLGLDLTARPRWVAGGAAILIEAAITVAPGSEKAGARGPITLWRMDPDGGSLRRLATDTAGGDLATAP
jgi:hypothetical protein